MNRLFLLNETTFRDLVSLVEYAINNKFKIELNRSYKVCGIVCDEYVIKQKGYNYENN